MVCRENKCRSAVMGYHKHLLRGMGYANYDDFELQSGIHEYGHQYEGFPAPTKEEQLAFLRGIRQQIENDPTISDPDKYRQSERQPGLITRIDQEISRLRTGVDEHGKPLRPEQLMRGNDYAAMQRLGALLRRGQHAKEAYFETYARTMGCSTAEARSRWDSSVSAERGGRGNVGISLRDDWRDRLAVAGYSAQQQADIGQSARARGALAAMEAERQNRLASLPTRPTITASHRTRCFVPGDPALRRQCIGGCGQFGHDASQCPNRDLLRARDQARAVHGSALARREAARQRYRDLRSRHPDLSAVRDDPAVVNEINEAYRESVAAERAYSRAATDSRMAEEALSDRAPKVSNVFQEIAYNRDSGHLEVTTHPRVRKSTGEVVPPTTYRYRLSREEHAEMMASSSVGSYANATFWRRGRGANNDNYKYENAADEAEATVQRHCPTCGRWASLNSGHQCPVPGSRQEALDAQRRADQRIARQAARAAGEPVTTAAPPREFIAHPNAATNLNGGSGKVYHPSPRTVTAALEQGHVVKASVRGQFLDSHTEGTVAVWEHNGERVVSAEPAAGATVRCACSRFRREGTCGHVGAIQQVVAQRYGATPVRGLTPTPAAPATDPDTPSPLDHLAETAQDAPRTGWSRMAYHRIRRERADRAATYIDDVREMPTLRTLRASPPLDATSNQPVPYPRTWTVGDRQVDLESASATQVELSRELRNRSGKRWSVTRNTDGDIRITTAQQRQAAGGVMLDDERAELARLLDIPSRRVSPYGVNVPADTSWRAEFLDRAQGVPRRIVGARFVARADQLPEHAVT